jgi:hypothetical protein
MRVNAATAFLALCLGSLLGSFVSEDAVEMLRGYVAPDNQMTDAVVRLILLWLPVILVTIFMARTIGHGSQRFWNAIPALAVGFVGVLLSVPFLTPAAQHAIYEMEWWLKVEEYKALVVVLGTMFSLILLRMRKPVDAHHAKHKRRHH